MSDSHAILAAQNNADLYALMFQAHGLDFDRRDYAFVGLDMPPPYYSNLTILEPGRSEDILDTLRQLSTRFGGRIGFKDSFCELEFHNFGFQLLFEATWIWRAPRNVGLPPGWEVVITDAELMRWETAWKAHGSPTPVHVFRPGLLSKPTIAFLGKCDGRGDYICGAIANASRDCVGLSNIFAVAPDAQSFAEASAAAEAVFGDRPLVGYENGRDLEDANACGFEPVGTLRIAKAENAFA